MESALQGQPLLGSQNLMHRKTDLPVARARQRQIPCATYIRHVTLMPALRKRSPLLDIYRKAAHCWWSSLPLLAFVAAVLVGAEQISTAYGSKASTGANLWATFYIAWYFHRHFLFHDGALTLQRLPGLKIKRPKKRASCWSLLRCCSFRLSSCSPC